jgi:hypothetical protein
MPTKRVRHALVPRALWRLLAGLSIACLGSACEEVPQDDFVFEGGNSPDPTAIFEGSILYVGPAPECVTWPDGSVHIRGNVVLTLFEYDNPPPPEGTATGSLNLLVVSGDQLFGLSDCALNGAQVTRSVPYTWPRLPLLQGTPKDYQIRGFFDYDDDFIPFFSVTRIPTAGDIAGAALNDVTNAAKGFLRISLPALEDGRKGVLSSGITVALGNRVRTERPAFKLDENRRLSASSPFELNFGPTGLPNFRKLTCAQGPDTPDCGLTLLRLGEQERAQLTAAGVALAIDDPSTYAFTAEPVDVKTVLPGPDQQVPDGVVDPHPFLAGLGINLFTPMLVLQRMQAPIEIDSKVPRAIMVGSVLLDGATALPTKRSYTGGAPIAVAPVVAVELVANDATCRVPYFPPGTSTTILNNRVAHCGELPTGRFAANVLGGVAGGTLAPADPSVSESGNVIEGGRYSGQSWSVPNELANPVQVGAENVLGHQGVDGTFAVYDPTPDAQTACSEGGVLFPRCAGDVAGVLESALPGIPNIDTADCLPSRCCEEIKHLWEVPEPRLCPYDEAGIRSSPSAIDHVSAANGMPVPNCLPFELPSQCRPE